MAKVVHSQAWAEAAKVSKVEVWAGQVQADHLKASRGQVVEDLAKVWAEAAKASEVWVWAGQVRGAGHLKVSRDRVAVVLPKMKMWTNKVRRCHVEG